MVLKVGQTEDRVQVLLSILSNIVSRAGMIEDGLSQIMNMQLGYVGIPFMPMAQINELPDEANAEGPGNADGVGDMDTDIVNNPNIGNMGFNNID